MKNMIRRELLLCLALVLPGNSQTLTRLNVADILGFENNTTAGAYPAGWTSWPAGTAFADDRVAHSGKWSARIERTASSPESLSSLTQVIPVDFAGKTVELRGFVKTENVSDYAALFVREHDVAGGSVAFASMQGLGLKGTNSWAEYSISVPWEAEARKLHFGFLLSGTGKAWVDDLQLLVDGQPVALAPIRPTTVLDTDNQFDGSSGITLKALSDTQIGNLALLAKVWGFLKYHHPAVTSGRHHWDYELFRTLPWVLGAADAAGAQAVLSNWVANLEPTAECSTCATLDTSDLHLNTNIDWISDASALGPELSRMLVAVHRNRAPTQAQFYVSLTYAFGNPSFDNEFSYPGLKLPDAGYQLLALFRFWNMVQYFFPYRDVMSDDPASSPSYWNRVLLEFIPRIALAGDSVSYQQEMMRFIAKINDTHANLWSSIEVRPPVGACYLPVYVRFIEGSPVVFRYTSATAGPSSGLKPGDIIRRLDGAAVSDLVDQWTPFYADSNHAARLRDIGRYLTRGSCGAASVVVQRGDQVQTLETARLPAASIDFKASSTHDLPGPTFQMLSPDIAYLKLSSVKAADSANYIQSAAGARGLIIDIRNYPSDFVVFTLGSLLVSEPVDFARFTYADIANPGAFHWTPPLGLTPQQPHYSGKVVILVDDVTQSSAEYHAMAFRAVPGAIVIGSTTAGADGNVSTVPLPGGLSSLFSALGIFYPDKSPTQRVGIVPDIVVTPTIAGIQAGRDELIEEAMRQIRSTRAEKSQSLPRPHPPRSR